MLLFPQTTDQDKCVIDIAKILFKGQDAQEIEQSLSEGIVKKKRLITVIDHRY